MAYGRKRGSCSKLVFSLPRWPDRSTHREQESADVLAAEHRCRVAKHALAVVPIHNPAARAARGGRSYALDERHGGSERKRPRARDV